MKIEFELPDEELIWEDNASLSIKQPSKRQARNINIHTIMVDMSSNNTCRIA